MSSTPEEFDQWFCEEHGIEAPPITSEDIDECVEDSYDEDSFGDIDEPPLEGGFYYDGLE